MAVWERQASAAQRQRRKMPSFSSSLLDAIYQSIDEPSVGSGGVLVHHRRNNAAQVEEEIESLRRAIMVEKWVEHYGGADSRAAPPRHLSSNSGSSTDSSAAFSSSETESSSASRSTPRSSSAPKARQSHTPPAVQPAGMSKRPADGAPPPPQKREGRFTRTKSRALKIYGDLKKVKEPNSPGAKIANFLNSIFSPRTLKKNNHHGLETDWSPVRKSRSLKDTTTTASRSCLMGKNPPSSGGNKSKRSVRFCPVSIILDEDSQPCGHKSLSDDGNPPLSSSMPSIGSQYIRKNINSFRICESSKNPRRHEFRDFYDNESDVDDRSCASSDLFELENIGPIGIRAFEEELPVYGTTSLQMNQAIASGLVM